MPSPDRRGGDDVKRRQRVLARPVRTGVDHAITDVFDSALDTAVRDAPAELSLPG